MLLNLNDPESILAWWKVYPDQHQNYLDYKLKANPEFAPAILEVQRRIAEDPDLRSLLVAAVRRRGQFEVHQAEGYVPRRGQMRDELAAA
jgi:hypothetical protein